MIRTLEAVRREEHLRELRASLLADIPRMRETQFRIGRTLLEIRHSGDLMPLGVTTFPMLYEAVGLSPTEGREYVAMVEAAAVRPEVETRVVEAKLSPQKASLVNELFQKPGLQKPGEDVLSLAQARATKDLIEEVKKRKEQARIGEPPVTRTMHFSAEECRDVDRTRVLVSRMLKRTVSDG